MAYDGTYRAGCGLSLVAGILVLAGGIFRTVVWGAMGWQNGMMGRLFGAPWGAWPAGLIGIAYGIAIIVLAALLTGGVVSQHIAYGAAIVALSVASFFGALAGFGLGLLLGVVGGALVLSE